MSGSATESSVCSVCGQVSPDSSSLPGVGQVCLGCLLAGRFLGTADAQCLRQVACQLPELNQAARQLIEQVTSEAKQLAKEKQIAQARDKFLQAARTLLTDGQPLAAATVLFRALGLPGQATEVYENLGQAALAMDRKSDAVQHFKTASWLALHSRNQAACRRILTTLAELTPGDSWIEKAQQDLKEIDDGEIEHCQICGRGAEEVGPLIRGTAAAICTSCVKEVMSLDRKPS